MKQETQIPLHPGEVLKSDYIDRFDGINQSTIADRIGVTRRAINEIVNKKRRVSPEIALKLAKLFGTKPEMWMTLQNKYDLWVNYNKNKNFIDNIVTVKGNRKRVS